MKLRDIKLENISKNRLRELIYFVLQYDEYCKERHALNYFVVPEQRMKTSDKRPTEDNALRLYIINKKIELIENVSRETFPRELRPYLMRHVCNNIPYEHMPVPCGRRQFYEYRRYFFYRLNEEVD